MEYLQLYYETFSGATGLLQDSLMSKSKIVAQLHVFTPTTQNAFTTNDNKCEFKYPDSQSGYAAGYITN